MQLVSVLCYFLQLVTIYVNVFIYQKLGEIQIIFHVYHVYVLKLYINIQRSNTIITITTIVMSVTTTIFTIEIGVN